VVRGKGRIQQAEKRIVDTRAAIEEKAHEMDKQEMDDRIKFNALIEALGSRLEQRGDPRFAQLNGKITASMRERNLAKLRFDNGGIRNAERTEIDRLEAILAIKTSQLGRQARALERAKEPGNPERRPTTPPIAREPIVKLPPLRGVASART
jgi:hypothetical protein